MIQARTIASALLVFLTLGCTSSRSQREGPDGKSPEPSTQEAQPPAEVDESLPRPEFVRLEWYSWMERLAAKVAREEFFADALVFVDETMSEEIARHVTEDARKIWPEIQIDEVRSLWSEREAGRWRHASYGLGTWMLGEEGALEGGAEDEQELSPERDAKREDLEEQRVAKGGASELEEFGTFWEGMTETGRRGWLLAYYAENSGDLERHPRPHLSECPTCAGNGYREVIYTGSARTDGGNGGLRKDACETCRTIGVIRRVYYR